MVTSVVIAREKSLKLQSRIVSAPAEIFDLEHLSQVLDRLILRSWLQINNGRLSILHAAVYAPTLLTSLRLIKCFGFKVGVSEAWNLLPR